MALSVVMPALEMAQETGKVVSWLKKEGEPVKKGEPLLEVETDKAVVEIESQGDGLLAGVKAREGDVVPVGQTIAWLLAPGEALPADTAPVAQTGRRMESGPQAATAAVAAPSSESAAAAGGARISPKARRLAKERGVDISSVRGSGPGGEILAEDILAAASGTGAAAASAVPTTLETLSAIGRLMAERTTQSWTTVPHFFVTRDVDATALNALRDELVPSIEKSHNVKPTHTDLLVALAGRVLRKHPRMNASWSGDSIRPNADVNVAIAMAVNDGVVAAVVRGADAASVAEIAVQRRELTERARANKLQPADLAGATFTISNLGMYQVDAFTAIIVQPQAGILAVGAIADRVVAVDGRPDVRPIMSMTLSSDHRVVDGARAAQFMSDLAAAISQPKTVL
jgi:pyruvate dehydrogenase E2 component (dihydrolipoamide acetyltransferase)